MRRAIPILLLCLLVTATCTRDNSDNAPPNVFLTISATEINFLETFLGDTRTFTIAIDNLGRFDAEISGVVGLAAPFSVSSPSAFPILVPAVGSADIVIAFNPTAEVTSSEVFVLNTSDTSHPQFTVTASGRGTLGDVSSQVVGGLFNLSAPVRLNGDCAVFWTMGPNNAAGDADDRLYLLDDSGSTPTLFEMVVGYAVHAPVRASDSTVYVTGPGTDTAFGTADDELLLINVLPGSFTTSKAVVGPLSTTDISTPAFLSDTRAAVLTGGTIPAFGGGDEEIVLVDFAVAGPLVVRSAVGTVTVSPASRPVAINDQVVALSIAGADSVFGTANEGALFVTYGNGDISTPAVTQPPAADLLDANRSLQSPRSTFSECWGLGADATPGTADDQFFRYLLGSPPTVDVIPGLNSRPFRVGDKPKQVVITSGPDFLPNTGDELLRAIEIVDKTSPLVFVDAFVPGLLDEEFSEPHIIDDDTSQFYFVSTTGPDLTPATADDVIYRVSMTSISSIKVDLSIPYLLGASAKPDAPAITSFFVTTMGVDGTQLTSDDGVMYARILPGFPIFTVFRDIPGLLSTKLGRVVALDTRNYLVVSAGPNLTLGDSDDAVVRVRIPPP